jgi:peptidoglycan/xylan/chitin deacetylase (PgdA/CDA1 family)
MRATLPQNLILDEGTLFEDFEVLGDWTPTDCTIEADTSLFKTGSQSLKITNTTSVTNAYAVKAINLNLSGLRDLGVWFYVEDDTKMDSLIIRLSSTTGFSRYLEFAAYNVHNGWNFVRWARSDAVNSGGEDWANTFIRLRVQTNGKSGQYPTTRVDSLYLNHESTPKIMICFDGSGSSLYDVIFPITESYGVRCINYVQSNEVGLPGYCTGEQLDELYAAGWDHGNHTETHRDMTTLSYEEQLQEIMACDAYLGSRGYARHRRCHFAPPLGAWNYDTISALQAAGYRSLRSGITGLVPHPPQSELFYMKVKEIQNTTNMSTVYALIDKCQQAKSTLIIFTHGAKNSDPGEYEMLTSDFIMMLNYIQDKNIPIVTISEWYSQLTHPRKVVTR